MKEKQPLQEVLPGVLTAAEIIKDHYRTIGRMGGLSMSEKKLKAVRKNVRKAIAGRQAKRAERRKALQGAK